MPMLKVAHVRQHGQDMLLFPLDRSFGLKPRAEQNAILGELELHAHRAGLAGMAAVFWENGGRTHSLGPKLWTGFLSSIGIHQVMASVNKQISW